MTFAGASDEELVSGCRAGRREAWDAFVDRYSRLVFWAVRKTLASTPYSRRQDLCEETFQDVFRKLLEPGGLDRLREASGLRSYLAVMACHAALDKVKAFSRREGKTTASLGADADGEPLEAAAFLKDGAPGPADRAMASERARLVAEAIAGLPPRDRACVEFHYLEGMTHREIAEILGMPQDTVSTVIRRAREALKAALAEKGFET